MGEGRPPHHGNSTYVTGLSTFSWCGLAWLTILKQQMSYFVALIKLKFSSLVQGSRKAKYLPKQVRSTGDLQMVHLAVE